MTRYRLKANHPTWIKLQKLINLANELQISLHFNDLAGCIILDQENPIENLILEDIKNEGRRYPNVISEFPYGLESKLIYEKE